MAVSLSGNSSTTSPESETVANKAGYEAAPHRRRCLGTVPMMNGGRKSARVIKIRSLQVTCYPATLKFLASTIFWAFQR